MARQHEECCGNANLHTKIGCTLSRAMKCHIGYEHLSDQRRQGRLEAARKWGHCTPALSQRCDAEQPSVLLSPHKDQMELPSMQHAGQNCVHVFMDMHSKIATATSQLSKVGATQRLTRSKVTRAVLSLQQGLLVRAVIMPYCLVRAGASLNITLHQRRNESG